MDIAEVAKIAGDALSRAEAAHDRLDELTGEVKDIRSLTAVMATANQKIDNLSSDVSEMKRDIKAISNRPSQWLDKLVAAAIGAIATGLVAAILKQILK